MTYLGKHKSVTVALHTDSHICPAFVTLIAGYEGADASCHHAISHYWELPDARAVHALLGNAIAAAEALVERQAESAAVLVASVVGEVGW